MTSEKQGKSIIMAGVIIVGAGQAGYKCAEALRAEGYGKSITIIGAEQHFPYQRPPLSKAYMKGEMDAASLTYRSDEYYDDHDLKLVTGTQVIKIEPGARRVHLASGKTCSYGHLVLACGSIVRKLELEGAGLDAVCSLQTIEDADNIAQKLSETENVVVIGAGFIGLEFAAVARGLGKSVTVLEAGDRVMARAVPPALSDYYLKLHQSRGVSIICKASVTKICGINGKVSAVRCADGSEYKAELVIVGIGALANTVLAQEAGLTCTGGIVVDAHGRTSDAHILAAGDCTFFVHPFNGAAMRLESVQNAIDQARAAAATITGKDKPYDAVPWFWSDQYDIKLQMVGLPQGCDKQVLRGDMAQNKFSIYHYRGDKLRAIDCVNRPGEAILGRKLLGAGISPMPDQAADTGFNLKSLMVRDDSTT